MHVAIVMNTAFGAKALRGDLIRFLLAEGHRVTVLCENDHAVAALRGLGASVIRWRVSRAGTNVLRDLLAVLRLRRRLVMCRPDVILNFTPKGVIYGSLAARLTGHRPVFSVITGLGHLFTDDRRRRAMRALVARLYRLALQRNARVFFQNPDDQELFIRCSVVPRSRTCRVYGSGVDIERFAPTRKPQGDRRETTFIMVARLLREKGVVEYLQAAAMLKRDGASVRAVLLGPFDDNPSSITPATLRNYERAGVVRYCGQVEDVRPYLDDADVFVLPSYREGTPRAALEALAMCKPVITTDAPGCRETVVDGDNGFLVAVGDASALAHAMSRFVGHSDIVASMGARSRAMAENRYDVRSVNRQLWSEVLEGAKLSEQP